MNWTLPFALLVFAMVLSSGYTLVAATAAQTTWENKASRRI
jgi:hypothetical protein